MKIEKSNSDEAVLRELGERIAALRLERNLTQAQLAERAGLSKRTVERLENGDTGSKLPSLIRACRALEILERFDAVFPEPTLSPMAALKLQRPRRQRASGRRKSAPKPGQWTWGKP